VSGQIDTPHERQVHVAFDGSRKTPMSARDWKGFAELIGIAAIVASLVFVGMELRQSQEIAIANQYQSRIELNLDFMSGESEQGFRISGEYFKQQVSDSDYPLEFKSRILERDTISLGRSVLATRRILFIFDNNHFQYQAGFVDEESWQAMRSRMIDTIHGNSLMQFVASSNPSHWRASLLREFEEMLRETGSED
jgi:hypothetical protein